VATWLKSLDGDGTDIDFMALVDLLIFQNISPKLPCTLHPRYATKRIPYFTRMIVKERVQSPVSPRGNCGG
jgi:hypothetical protein